MKGRKEEIIFCFGVFNLLSAILMLDEIDIFIFFLIISFLCFINCRKLLLKILCHSVVKRKIRLMREEKRLKQDVDLLIRKKTTLELFISDNDKYVNEIIDYGNNVEKLKEQINVLQLEKKKITANNYSREKELEQDILVLETRKENLEDFMKQEEVISRAINDKSELFDILSNKNEDLKQQNRELKDEVELLEKQLKPMKQRVNFAKTVSLEYVDGLDGFEFEDFTRDLLKCLGFEKCITTQSTGDYGIDVIAEKDGVKYGIQCKNYQNEVGNKAIQEAYSGKNYYSCHVAIVLTNNYFTSSAINQAEKNGVVLWNRDKLKEFIETLT